MPRDGSRAAHESADISDPLRDSENVAEPRDFHPRLQKRPTCAPGEIWITRTTRGPAFGLGSWIIFGLEPKVEAAGIEPASADAPERASTSLSCDFASPAGRLQATYRRASHPLEVPLRAIGSPSAASPLLAPDSVPRAEDGATSLPN
jgi:hypothetical protein